MNEMQRMAGIQNQQAMAQEPVWVRAEKLVYSMLVELRKAGVAGTADTVSVRQSMLVEALDGKVEGLGKVVAVLSTLRPLENTFVYFDREEGRVVVRDREPKDDLVDLADFLLHGSSCDRRIDRSACYNLVKDAGGYMKLAEHVMAQAQLARRGL